MVFERKKVGNGGAQVDTSEGRDVAVYAVNCSCLFGPDPGVDARRRRVEQVHHSI